MIKTLHHYSPNTRLVLNDYLVRQHDYARHKPQGLWLSDDSDYGWKQWCLDEEFNLDRLVSRTQIDVDMEHVLHLGSINELRAFERQYETIPQAEMLARIRWKDVAKHYKGVLITPYQWEHRHVMWYNTWDCASACIWDTSCLTVGETERNDKLEVST